MVAKESRDILTDDEIPVVVRVRSECTWCGHFEDDTYEFDLPIKGAQPLEQWVRGKCPDCGAKVRIYLRRTWQMQ